MPKTIDEIVRDVLGNQLMQIVQLQAQNSALAEENAALKSRVAESEAAKAAEGII